MKEYEEMSLAQGGRSERPAGVDRRVAVAQGQARAAMRIAFAFAVAAPLAAWVPHRTGWWLPLHLFLVGGLLSAISGAAPLFAVTWAAGPPPSRWAAAVQRCLIAAGAVGLAAGRELSLPRWTVVVSGLAVIAGVIALAAILVRVVIHAVQRRFDAAVLFYVAGLMSGTAGCALGLVMVVGLSGPELGRVKAAHVALNLLGLVGLVVAGTLPFFVATEARTKMSPRATAASLQALLGWLVASLAVGAAGLLSGARLLSAAGLGAYALGVVGLVRVVPRIRAKQLAWAGPRLLQLGAGMGWWVAGSLLAAVRAGEGRPPFTAAALAMIAVGGYGQILGASLAYLGPVLRGGGHERLTGGFATTRSWTGLVAANAACVGLAGGWGRAAAVALAVWVGDAVWRGARLGGAGRLVPRRGRVACSGRSAVEQLSSSC